MMSTGSHLLPSAHPVSQRIFPFSTRKGSADTSPGSRPCRSDRISGTNVQYQTTTPISDFTGRLQGDPQTHGTTTNQGATGTMRETTVHLTNPMRILPFLLLALVCGLTSAADAQQKSIKQYVHQTWTTANGLPQNSASDIIQSKDGYIWFATQEGIARFDGVQFTVFDRTTTPELDDSWVVALLEDREGGIWGRPNGITPRLFRYLNGTFFTYDTTNGLPSNDTRAWTVDSSGSVWIGSTRGLSVFSNDRFTRTYTTRDGLPSDTVFALSADSKGTVWVSTPRGFARLRDGTIETLTGRTDFPDTMIFRIKGLGNVYEDSRGTIWMHGRRDLISYDGTTFTRYPKKNALSSPILRDAAEARDGSIWFATDAGLNRFSGGTFSSITISADRDENSIHEIHEDRQGSLWLVTNKGIARYAGGKIEKYQQSDGLSDNAVQRMLIDNEGSIWVSTFGGGVDRFRDEKFVTYSSKVGLSYDNVQSVIQDRNGAIWIGTTYGGLNRLANGALTVLDTRHGLAANDVLALAEDAEGTLWIGTPQGVCTYRNGTITKRAKVLDGTPDIIGNAFVRRKSGAWLVASRSRVYAYSNGKFALIAALDSVSTNRTFISNMFEDVHGTLWICTAGGNFWYRDGVLEPLGKKQGYPGGWIMASHQDPDGTLWLGASNHGLYRYKNGVFANISPREGLFDYTSYTLLEDDAGYLWMSSNKGVYRAKKQDLNDVADGKASRLTCSVYGTADGMETIECNGGYYPTGWKTQDGRLCFATTKGLAVVNPSDITINDIPPPVVIDRFIVEGTRFQHRSPDRDSCRQQPVRVPLRGYQLCRVGKGHVQISACRAGQGLGRCRHAARRILHTSRSGRIHLPCPRSEQ